MIRIIDCGSQLTQNIARRIREHGVYSEIVPFNSPVGDITKGKPDGLIISGGQFSVYDEESPLYDKKILELGIPVLGICYGQQSIAYILGGRVTPAKVREYGDTKISIINESPLFKDIPEKEFTVWMSHGDMVDEIPDGFKIVAVSQGGSIAAMQNGNIFSVQFHPEADHTNYGRKILENFIDICNASRNWDPRKEYDKIVSDTKEKIAGKTGVGGVSGGVDSTTAAVLISKIKESNFHPIFVDTGLLRLNEARQVKEMYDSLGLKNVIYADAQERFLDALKGISDPEKKRKIIGHEFIDVFENEAKKIKGASYLVQGTLYADVIESVPLYGCSSKIKSHHNVGGLPDKMGLEIVEPFRSLFKDEVRRIAEESLRIPRQMVWRHPCPGPGLAVRIIGDITREKLDILKQADAIYMEELHKRGLYDKISQAFAVLTGINSIGVMGDEGNYQAVIALRAVTTNDFMTADWFGFNKEDLSAISSRIVNEVKNVNRIVYDITQKPPATIEWE